jgi:hypothetical protein
MLHSLSSYILQSFKLYGILESPVRITPIGLWEINITKIVRANNNDYLSIGFDLILKNGCDENGKLWSLLVWKCLE